MCNPFIQHPFQIVTFRNGCRQHDGLIIHGLDDGLLGNVVAVFSVDSAAIDRGYPCLLDRAGVIYTAPQNFPVWQVSASHGCEIQKIEKRPNIVRFLKCFLLRLLQLYDCPSTGIYGLRCNFMDPVIDALRLGIVQIAYIQPCLRTAGDRAPMCTGMKRCHGNGRILFPVGQLHDF